MGGDGGGGRWGRKEMGGGRRWVRREEMEGEDGRKRREEMGKEEGRWRREEMGKEEVHIGAGGFTSCRQGEWWSCSGGRCMECQWP